MRKFTLFLMSLVLTIGAMAQIKNGAIYSIQNKKHQTAIAQDLKNNKLFVKAVDKSDCTQLWQVEGDENGYTLRNVVTGAYAMYVDEYYTHWFVNDNANKFYIGKMSEATETDPDYYYISFRAIEDITQGQHSAMHASNGYVVRWEQTADASLWNFVELTTEELDAIQTSQNTTFENKKNDVQVFLNAAGFSKVELTVDMLSTNAPETEGGGIPSLIDNIVRNNSNFFHSNWHNNGASNDGGAHYIQINFDEIESISQFCFSYVTRTGAANDYPKTIEIYGSEDGDNFETEPITTVNNLPSGSGIYVVSPLVKSEKSYNAIRLVVTETSTDRVGEGKAHNYFHMGEFYFYKANEETEKYNSHKLTALTEIANIIDTMPENLTLAEKGYFVRIFEEYTYKAAIREYPFTLTTDAQNPVCYLIKSGRCKDFSNYSYWKFVNNKIQIVEKEEADDKDIECFWYFMEDPNTGYVEIYPFINPIAMGYTTITEEGADKITNTGNLDNDYTIVGPNTTDAYKDYPYAFQPKNGAYYVSQHGGRGKNLGFYSGFADGGTRVAFEQVGTPIAKLRELNSAIKSMPEMTAGTTIGSYTEEVVNNRNSILESALAIYNDYTIATDENCQEQINAINGFVNSNYRTMIVKPKPGTIYRLKNNSSKNYLQSSLAENGRLNVTGSNFNTSVFYYDGNTIVSFKEGRSIDPGKRNLADMGIMHEVSIEVPYNNASNCVVIKANGCYIYGAGATADRGSGIPNNDGYNWIFEEVSWVPVGINTEIGWGTLYSPVAMNYSQHGRVKAYTAKVKDGYIDLTEIEGGIIPANTGVVLEYIDGAENDCVYMQQVTYNGEELDSDLTGEFVTSQINKEAGFEYYVLSAPSGKESVGMYIATNANEDNTSFINSAFKAYLKVENSDSNEAPAYSLRFDFGGTTAVEDVETENEVEVIFDLQGRRVNEITAGGIYIINGKKVLVK